MIRALALLLVAGAMPAQAACIPVERFASPAVFAQYATGNPGDDPARLGYRRDTRLLVVTGARNEETATAGVALYDWRSGGPRRIRFVPQARLCAKGSPQ